MARLLWEGQATWANNAPANTPVNLDIPVDPGYGGNDRYIIVVRNPSPNTAIKVDVKVKETTDAQFGGGSDRFPLVAGAGGTVPANTPEGAETTVDNWGIGDQPGRLTLSNVTALGAAQGFTADVRIRVAPQAA